MENEAKKDAQPIAVPTVTKDLTKEKIKVSFVSKIPHVKILLGVLGLVILISVIGLLMFLKKQEAQRDHSNVFRTLRAGDFESAQQIAKKGLEKTADDKYLLSGLINGITSQGNQTGTEKNALSKAQPIIDKALQSNPKDRDTLISAGYAYETAGEYEKALSYYEQAIAADPTFAQSYFHKGHTLAFLNREQESQEAYDKAYQLDPNDPYVLFTKANAAAESGNSVDSVNYYYKVATNTSAPLEVRAEAYTGAALVLSGKKINDLSLLYAKNAVYIDPNYALGLGIYGFNLSLTGKVKDGLNYILTGIHKNEKISFNNLFAAYILRSIHREKEALEYQQNQIALIPNDNTIIGEVRKNKQMGLALYEMAETYSQLKDSKNALVFLKQSYSKDPTLIAKTRIDIKNGYFANIKNSAEFLSLLK